MLDNNVMYSVIGVVVLLIVSYLYFSNKSEKTNNIVTKFLRIGTKSQTVPTGFFADTTTNDYVMVDKDGNLTASNKLNYNISGAKNLIGTSDVISDLIVAGNNSFYPGKKWNNMYYPEDAIIYRSNEIELAANNIFNSTDRYDTTKTLYLDPPAYVPDRFMSKIVNWEGNNTDIYSFPFNSATKDNSVIVKIPQNKDVLWFRILSDRFASFSVWTMNKTLIGNFSSGTRNRNRIAPDGGSGDSSWNRHEWIAIPVRGQSSVRLGINDAHDIWISGLAFTTNPWNHAYDSAYNFIMKKNNPGNDATANMKWANDSVNPTSLFNDILGDFTIGVVHILYVPVVASGKDKLIYIIEHQNTAGEQEANVTNVKINGTSIERFRNTYDNPFARHHNNRFGGRYIAARIPSNLIPNNQTLLKVEIDLTKTNRRTYFREIGTHDLY